MVENLNVSVHLSCPITGMYTANDVVSCMHVKSRRRQATASINHTKQPEDEQTSAASINHEDTLQQ